MTKVDHPIRIEFAVDGRPLPGTLTYVKQDHSFGFEPADRQKLETRRGPDGSTSIEIGTLQIEVGVATRGLLYAWGYHPVGSWVQKALLPPEILGGSAWLAPGLILKPGVAHVLASVGQWRTWHDPLNGWIRVGPDDQDDTVTVMIADGVAIGIRGGFLQTVWLHPSFR
jgi:hypothetical protein